MWRLIVVKSPSHSLWQFYLPEKSTTLQRSNSLIPQRSQSSRTASRLHRDCIATASRLHRDCIATASRLHHDCSRDFRSSSHLSLEVALVVLCHTRRFFGREIIDSFMAELLQTYLLFFKNDWNMYRLGFWAAINHCNLKKLMVYSK